MKAAVLEEIERPLAIRELDMATHHDNVGGLCLLEHGQVMVKMLCAGICGAQLQEIRGEKGNTSYLPHLLGHEGCGIVQETGLRVTEISKGDKVVVHWRKGRGLEAPGGTYGNVKSGPCATFSEYTIASENRCTKVPENFPADLGALLGCSLSTALATIEAQCTWAQDILVVGCGGLGLALILASRLAHPRSLWAHDKARIKSDRACSLGAIFLSEPFPTQKFDVILDTVGDLGWIDNVKPSGKYILIGQWYGHALLKPRHLFEGEGKTIRAVQAGGFQPDIDIPRYVDLWKRGLLEDYRKIIGHRVDLEHINDGIELLRTGRAMGRVMIDFK